MIVAVPAPATVGVPEITPELEIVTPVGSPVAEKMSDSPELSVAWTVRFEIGLSCGQLWEAGAVTVTTGWLVTVSGSDNVPVALSASVAVTVAVKVPELVGSPESTPALDNERPVGSPEAE